MPTREIAVIGAGPSGLAFAAAAKGYGHRVSVFEARADVDKGGTGVVIQPAGLLAARVLAVGDALEREGHRIGCVRGTLGASGHRIIDLCYERIGMHAIAVERAALVARLRSAADPHLELGVRVAAIEGRGPVTLRGATGSRLGEFDLVVDASGPRSRLAGLPYRKRVRTWASGSLWSTVRVPGFRHGRGAVNQIYGERSDSVGFMHLNDADDRATLALFWNVRGASVPAMKRRGLAEWKAHTLALEPRLAPVMCEIKSWSQLGQATFHDVSYRRAADVPVVPIGDSAHAVNPIIGQGVSAALVDGVVLARLLEERRNPLDAIAAFEALRRRQMGLARGLARLLVPFYQSESPTLAMLRNRLAPFMSLPPLDRLAPLVVSGLWPNPRLVGESQQKCGFTPRRGGSVRGDGGRA